MEQFHYIFTTIFIFAVFFVITRFVRKHSSSQVKEDVKKRIEEKYLRIMSNIDLRRNNPTSSLYSELDPDTPILIQKSRKFEELWLVFFKILSGEIAHYLNIDEGVKLLEIIKKEMIYAEAIIFTYVPEYKRTETIYKYALMVHYEKMEYIEELYDVLAIAIDKLVTDSKDDFNDHFTLPWVSLAADFNVPWVIFLNNRTTSIIIRYLADLQNTPRSNIHFGITSERSKFFDYRNIYRSFDFVKANEICRKIGEKRRTYN